jgi:formylmethanofuran dehydrogenase subunit C
LLTLRSRRLVLPVDGAPLRPDLLAHAAAEVARLKIRHGKSLVEVGELFEVEGDGRDQRVAFEGDLRSIRGLASGMTSGELTISGLAGDGLAQGMTDGSVIVDGDVGAHAGAGMRGGFLRIRGNAGPGLGGCLPGSRLGMRDGVILVEGNVGAEAGRSMRRGLIAVKGKAGTGLGSELVAGSIFSFGAVEGTVGAGMKRGTIALFRVRERDRLPVPTTFAPSGSFRPPFLGIYERQLRAWGFLPREVAFPARIRRYNGDLLERGQGEILLAGLDPGKH